jgi:glycosyltransferase involved in cell wall biosynthesis
VRVLWAVSNWKRTGPVEPSLDLAAALQARGHEVLVLTGRPIGDAPDEAGDAAAARGLSRLDLGLVLDKHLRPIANRRDAARVAAHLAARPPHAVVTRLRNDHRVLARALRSASSRAPLVRLLFEDGATPPSSSEARLLRDAASVVVFGAAPAAACSAAGVAPGAVVRMGPPLDLDRVRRAARTPDAARARLDPSGGAFLVGIVARVQPHRRFDLLWDAAARLVEEGVAFRLVLIGRGTRFDALARDPVSRRGLEGHVVLAGYLLGEDYASTLAALDAQVMLVPGSDPTCRALREGMALSRAVVATRRGLLPDLVEDGESGLLVDSTPESLAGALVRLARDPALRARLGAGAAARADAEFALPRAAERLEAVLVRGYAGRPSAPR